MTDDRRQILVGSLAELPDLDDLGSYEDKVANPRQAIEDAAWHQGHGGACLADWFIELAQALDHTEPMRRSYREGVEDSGK